MHTSHTTLHITDLTAVSIEDQQAMRPPCAACSAPGAVIVDAPDCDKPVCAKCFIETKQPTLHTLVVAALPICLLLIGAPLGLACVALPPVLCAKCQYCGASTWPGIYTCASCRKERQRSSPVLFPMLVLLAFLVAPMGAITEGACRRCKGWSTNIKRGLCPGCRILGL